MKIAVSTRNPREIQMKVTCRKGMPQNETIAVRLTPEPFPPGIDTEADLARAEQWLQAQG